MILEKKNSIADVIIPGTFNYWHKNSKNGWLEMMLDMLIKLRVQSLTIIMYALTMFIIVGQDIKCLRTQLLRFKVKISLSKKGHLCGFEHVNVTISWFNRVSHWHNHPWGLHRTIPNIQSVRGSWVWKKKCLVDVRGRGLNGQTGCEKGAGTHISTGCN